LDTQQNRIALTAKKSLVESSLPIVATFQDAKAGLVTLAVVHKVLAHSLLVEFYNNVKGVVPQKETRRVFFNSYLVLQLITTSVKGALILLWRQFLWDK
jgi:rRNA biogenesis protein RRP5